jgi:hypothetical protein
MKSRKAGAVLAATWMLVLAAVVVTDGFAQAGSRVPTAAGVPAAPSKPVAVEVIPGGSEDMQLWSFGDCDKRFPLPDSEAHRQCVRVVDSDEARDARAYHVCQMSNGGDPAESARCKAAYDANREQALRAGFVPRAAVQAPSPAPSDVTQNVNSVAAAAVPGDRATAAAPAVPAPAASKPELAPTAVAEGGFWSPRTIVGTLSVLAMIVAAAATMARRKRTGVLENG